ncbi:hypothetical protein AgCh_023588 [Apium graveolens]
MECAAGVYRYARSVQEAPKVSSELLIPSSGLSRKESLSYTSPVIGVWEDQHKKSVFNMKARLMRTKIVPKDLVVDFSIRE